MSTVNIISDFFPLISSFSAMIVSQIIKLSIMLLKKNQIKWNSLSRSGGMPSSHSALITSITLSLALKEGITSSYFFIAVVMSVIVIYDARGIRHAVGKHAKLINNKVLSNNETQLNEAIGHTLPEIIIGICLGVIVTLAVFKTIVF